MRKQRIDVTGATALVIWSAVLGLNQVMIKIVNAGFAPVFQAGLRSVCAFLPVLIYALIRRKHLSISDGTLLPGLAVGLLFSGEFILVFQGLDYTSVARASILFYTMPFWVAVGAHFLIPGERLTGIRVLGLVLATAGVTLAMANNHAPATDRALIGDVMCLVAAIFWAGIALLAKASSLSRTSPEMQLLYQLGVSAVVVTLLAPLFGDLVRELTPLIIAVFAFQVLFVVCIGFVIWFWLLAVYPASDMSSFSFLAPVFGVAFSWLILDEPLSATILGALFLVAIGIVLVNRKPRPTA